MKRLFLLSSGLTEAQPSLLSITLEADTWFFIATSRVVSEPRPQSVVVLEAGEITKGLCVQASAAVKDAKRCL